MLNVEKRPSIGPSRRSNTEGISVAQRRKPDSNRHLFSHCVVDFDSEIRRSSALSEKFIVMSAVPLPIGVPRHVSGAGFEPALKGRSMTLSFKFKLHSWLTVASTLGYRQRSIGYDLAGVKM